ncbi:MAG: polysaccharide biosynthesis tyrosine autokinase [Nitrospirae bacterium]|nr:polysaccharide biosynthesis tyrosine autokinase [Nitrospirota bacterium]
MNNRGAAPEGNLFLDLVRVARKRRWIIVVTALAALAVGWSYAKGRKPAYQARATIEFEKPPATALGQYGWSDDALDLQTELEVITSLPVLLEVAKRLGEVPVELSVADIMHDEPTVRRLKAHESQLRVRSRGGTRLVDIIATSSEPQQARDLANAVADTFKGYRLEQAFRKSADTKDISRRYQERLDGLLAEAEEKVRRHREEHGLVGVDAAVSVNLGRLAALEEEEARLARQVQQAERLIQVLSEGAFLDGDTLPSLEWRDAPPEYQSLRSQLLESVFQYRDRAHGWTAEHPEVQEARSRAERQIEQLSVLLARQIEDLHEQQRQLGESRDRLQERNGAVIREDIELARLQRQVDRYRTMIDSVDAATQQAQLSGAIQSSNVRLVEYALLPSRPIERLSMLPAASFAVVGIILGIALAFLRESLDFSLDTVADVERFLGIPVLGIIPHFELRQTIEQEKKLRRKIPRLTNLDHAVNMVVHFWPKSPVSESFQSLRMLLRRRENMRVILVTSATPQEGKSFVAVNLALSFAQGQMRTVLVEANTRRPTLHKRFPVSRGPGLTNIASEGMSWKDVAKGIKHFIYGGIDLTSLEASPGLDNLHVINAGPTPVHPPTTLDLLTQRGLLNELREAFDVIVVDSPPTLPVADASVLAPYVDGIVLVYHLGKTARDVTLRTLDHLRGAQGKIVGIVLNDVDYHGPYFYSRYAYRYPYLRYTPDEDYRRRNAFEKLRDFVTTRARRRGGRLRRQPMSPDTWVH